MAQWVYTIHMYKRELTHDSLTLLGWTQTLCMLVKHRGTHKHPLSSKIHFKTLYTDLECHLYARIIVCISILSLYILVSLPVVVINDLDVRDLRKGGFVQTWRSKANSITVGEVPEAAAWGCWWQLTYGNELRVMFVCALVFSLLGNDASHSDCILPPQLM